MPAPTPPVPTIPREVLFGNPVKTSPKLSPDGKLLAYIAPDEGVLNAWVKTVGKDDDRPVTRDRGVRFYFWADFGRNTATNCCTSKIGRATKTGNCSPPTSARAKRDR